jgi:hypothetical protein
VPGGGLLGTSGVESGKAAPLVGGPPGVVLHTVVDGLPSGDTGDVVPVVLLKIGEGMVPSGVAGIIASDDIVAVDDIVVAVLPAMDVEAVVGTVDGVGVDVAVTAGAAAAIGDDATGTVEPGKSVTNDVAGVADSKSGAVELAVVEVGEVADTVGIVAAADVEGVVPIAPPVADMEITGTAGVPGAICPVGVAQVTTVPGVVGSEAIGTGASVVSGLPGWVVAENGLGPLSGEVTIAPGVVARPMDVVPKVETCARQAVQPASRVTIISSKRRIGITPSQQSACALYAP